MLIQSYRIRQKSSATIESIKSYHDLITTTKADLEDRLESIDSKLEYMSDSITSFSGAETREVKLIQEERLSLQKCVEICAKLSTHIDQTQLSAELHPSQVESNGTGPLSERITSKALQDCKDSIDRATEELGSFEQELRTRFLNPPATTVASEREIAELARLRGEWEASRRCMQIYTQAAEDLPRNTSIIDCHTTGDVVESFVSTGENTILVNSTGLHGEVEAAQHGENEECRQTRRSSSFKDRIITRDVTAGLGSLQCFDQVLCKVPLQPVSSLQNDDSPSNTDTGEEYGAKSSTADKYQQTKSSFTNATVLFSTGQGELSEKHKEVEDDTSDIMSVRTDGRRHDLPEDIRRKLIEVFVEDLAENLGLDVLTTLFIQEHGSEELEALLRDFSILLEKSAPGSEVHGQTVTFIRHQRPAIVKELDSLAKAPKPSAAGLPTLEEKMALLWRSKEQFEQEKEDYMLDAGLGDFASALPQDVPVPQDALKARKFLNQSHQFSWLLDRINYLGTVQQTGDTQSAIRAQIADTIGSIPEGEALGLILQWDPLTFFREQHAQNQTDISGTIVFCGTKQATYATTVKSYLQMNWPGVCDSILGSFREACANGGDQGPLDLLGASMQVQFLGEFTTVRVWKCSGIDIPSAFSTMLEIAEAYVWLSVACRAHEEDNIIGTCTPQLTDAKNAGHQSCQLLMIPTINTVQRNEKEQDDLCWTGMVRNPAIARGYPIPLRNDPGRQKGLELSLDLMVALSRANWATTFDDKFVLKGIKTALVPVMIQSTWIVWHFLMDSDETRMTHEHVRATTTFASAGSIDVDSLHDRRHFVGIWTSHACVITGSNNATSYELELSESKPATYYTCSLSNVSISGGKFVSFGAAFSILRKDRAVDLCWSEKEPYELHIQNVSAMNIVLYSGDDRRAWLVDGASALFYLARAWMVSASARYMSRTALDSLQDPKWPGGKDSALDALIANRDRGIQIFQQAEEEIHGLEQPNLDQERFPDCLVEAGTTSFVSSAISGKATTTTSGWKYEDLVISLCKTLQSIHFRLATPGDRSPEIDIKSPTAKPVIAGFEAVELISSRGPYKPRVIELGSHAENWIKFVAEQCQVVLLADTWGEIIQPQISRGSCLRSSSMCTGQDLLAVHLPVFRDLAKRWKKNKSQSLRGRIQITDYVWWHSFHEPSSACNCTSNSTCQIYSQLGRKAEYVSQDQLGELSTVDVFDLYPHGAAIIGGNRNELEKLCRTASRSGPYSSIPRLQSSFLRRKRDQYFNRHDSSDGRISNGRSVLSSNEPQSSVLSTVGRSTSATSLEPSPVQSLDQTQPSRLQTPSKKKDSALVSNIMAAPLRAGNRATFPGTEKDLPETQDGEIKRGKMPGRSNLASRLPRLKKDN